MPTKKYVYKIPLAPVIEFNKGLIISHSIFLDRHQRYILQQPDNYIETIGVSVPVWIEAGQTDEPAKEVFARYRIQRSTTTDITQATEGYQINLQKTASLRDIKDEGSECSIMVFHGTMKVNEKNYIAIHQLSILTSEFLEQSMHFCKISS